MQQRPRATKRWMVFAGVMTASLGACGIEATGEIGSDHSPTVQRISPLGPMGVSSGAAGMGGIGNSNGNGNGGTTTTPPPATPTDTPPTTPPTTTPPPTTPPPTTTPPTTTPPTPPPMVTGTLVPLYTRPTDNSWATLVSAKKAHPNVPVVAVVNPANGPGASISQDYANGIAKLVEAGIRVIGYVSTNYAMRAEAQVKADIDTWKKFYPQVTGIFFDEQANKTGFENYYKSVSQYAKSQGLSFTVGNPGADTLPSYVGTVDMILIYESSGLPDMSRIKGWHMEHDRNNFGVIPYGTSLNTSFIQAMKPHVGYIYLTSDVLPNPWDSVPAYLQDLLAALST